MVTGFDHAEGISQQLPWSIRIACSWINITDNTHAHSPEDVWGAREGLPHLTTGRRPSIGVGIQLGKSICFCKHVNEREGGLYAQPVAVIAIAIVAIGHQVKRPESG